MMIMKRGGCSSPYEAIYVLKWTPMGKVIIGIYPSVFPKIPEDIVHHHPLPIESIFYPKGLSSHKCNLS